MYFISLFLQRFICIYTYIVLKLYKVNNNNNNNQESMCLISELADSKAYHPNHKA